MEWELEGYTTLMIIKEAKMSFFADFMIWATEWCKGVYDDPVVRNTPEGYYELLGKLKTTYKL